MALPSDLLIPTAQDAKTAREIRRALKAGGAIRLTLTLNEGGVEKTLKLSEQEHPVLMEALTSLAKGKPVVVLPVDKELSTQQAADLLNVSRPYLIGLLESGKIDYSTVGRHRRVAFAALMEYKRHAEQRARAAADEMADLGQELGL